MRTTFVQRTAFAMMLAAASLGACQLIVPGDFPEVKCATADPSGCPSGMACDLSAGKCVTSAIVPEASDGPDGDIEPDDGGPDGDAPAVGLADLGANCVVDGDCKSGLCGTSTILTTAIISGPPICTSTCCTSADCPPSFVCFNGGTGGGYCVPAVKAGRVPPATGGKAAGATCGGSSECRSGLCEGARCIDTCCISSNCATGTTCRVKEITTPQPAHFIWACAPPNAGGLDPSPDASCTQQSQCKNDNCVGFPSRCTPSCCTIAHCTQQGFSGSICAYGNTGNDQLKFCVRPVTGGAAIGATCAADTDCQSRYCDPELRKCATICCTDADCLNRAKCKPSKSGTPFLRCVPIN